MPTFQDVFEEHLIINRDVAAAQDYYNMHGSDIDLNFGGLYGNTILHRLVCFANFFGSQFLASALEAFSDGFNLNAQDSDGITPRDIAVRLQGEDGAMVTVIDEFINAHQSVVEGIENNHPGNFTDDDNDDVGYQILKQGSIDIIGGSYGYWHESANPLKGELLYFQSVVIE